MFKGLFTALITPFKYGSLDEEAYIKLIEWQINSGVHGFVTCGSTGEAQNLSRPELHRAIELCVRTVNGRVPVIAGTGSASTSETIEISNEAKNLGVDGILVVTPYYLRPAQEGLYQHYKAINDEVAMPIMIYNVPRRTSVDISDETIIRLAKLEHIVGLKDATGDLSRISNIINEVAENFVVFAGDDETALGFNAQGGAGCISVVSNIYPSLCAKIQDHWFAGDWRRAFEIQKMLASLFNILFCETNPVPIKYAASLFEICSPDVRLPLVPLSERNKKLIKE
ncbi:unnamed protein product, partial [Sphagnum jensenii]